MHVLRPFQNRKKWMVEISHYPESRCIETWEFDTQDEALAFYRANTQRNQTKDGQS